MLDLKKKSFPTRNICLCIISSVRLFSVYVHTFVVLIINSLGAWGAINWLEFPWLCYCVFVFFVGLQDAMIIGCF